MLEGGFFSSKALLAILACLGYMFVSSTLIILNKHILSVTNFHYPMALAGLGMLFSWLGAVIAIYGLRIAEAKATVSKHRLLTNILPVGLASAVTLNFGNAVYLYLTVSLIQMLKAFCPVLVMVCLFAARLETPTQKLIGSVVIISLGTLMSSYGEMNFNLVGFIYMGLAESAEAVKLTLMQLLMQGLKFEPMEGLLYLGGCSCFWLGIGVISLELPLMIKEDALSLILQHPTLFACAASMGFMVNLLALAVVKLTSGLTLKVLGTAKNAAIVLFCCLFMAEQVTMLQFLGYSISLGGFFYYNYIKIAQTKPAAAQKPTTGVAAEKATLIPAGSKS